MTLRSRHLIAYSAAMFALLILQLVFYADVFATLSDFSQDVCYTLISQVFCMGLVPFCVLLILNKGRVKEPLRVMRYKAPRDHRSCLLISLGMMLLIVPFTMAFNALTNLLFQIVGYKRGYSVGTIYSSAGDFPLMLLMTAVLPAVFEEFSHRGVLLSGLQSGGSEMHAVILSAVAFGLMHMNPAQMIFATFGGLAFGVAVVKCDSVIPAMCAHFANNAVSVVLDYSTQKETALGVWYDRLTSSGSVLSVGLTFVVLGVALYGMVRLLQYAARKAPKPVREGKLLGLVTLDLDVVGIKATMKENASLIATMIAEGAFLLFLFLWGIVK